MRQPVCPAHSLIVIALLASLAIAGCADSAAYQARQSPRTGSTSHWLRQGDPESYQTPSRRPALATDAENQPRARVPCEQPGPKFPATTIAAYGTEARSDNGPVAPTLIHRQELYDGFQDPLPPPSPTKVFAVDPGNPTATTREVRGFPAIGGWDRRTVSYAGSNRGVEPTRIGAMAVDDTSWCVDP